MKPKLMSSGRVQTRPAFASIPTWCELSGMSRSGTYLALKSGHLVARKIGARTVIDVDAGLNWIASKPSFNAA